MIYWYFIITLGLAGGTESKYFFTARTEQGCRIDRTEMIVSTAATGPKYRYWYITECAKISRSVTVDPK